VSFTVRNTDASLPTSNEGGTAGDYDYTVSTTAEGAATDVSAAALELVPSRRSRRLPRHVVDGQEASGSIRVRC